MEKFITNLFQSIEKELENLFKSNEQKLLELIRNIREDKIAWNHRTNFEYYDRYDKMKKSARQRNLYIVEQINNQYQWVYKYKSHIAFSERYSLEDLIIAYQKNNIRWQMPIKPSDL